MDILTMVMSQAMAGNGSGSDPGGVNIHLCAQDEYNASTMIPTIQDPDEHTIYLVPAAEGDRETNDQFIEWYYVNDGWEIFGRAKVDVSGLVEDVQVNGSSIVSDGVANIPVASSDTLGTVKVLNSSGIQLNGSNQLGIRAANKDLVKSGVDTIRPIASDQAHRVAFYGLTKAAGVDMRLSSGDPVGNYTDGAKGAIQHMLGVDELIAQREPNSTTASKAYTTGEVFTWRGKLYKATTDIASGATLTVGTNCEQFKVAEAAAEAVSDVKVNGTSVVTDGVANVPVATENNAGVSAVSNVLGIGITGTTNKLYINKAGSTYIKGGTDEYRPIVPYNQHDSTFYGLAKAAGADEKNSTLALGTYTETAKSAISQMLSAPETVSGSTPSITAKAGIRYICGECSTLDITTPASGIVDIIFESGSTPTVLTVTPPTGSTMQWPSWFDPTALEANKTYELNIADGVFAAIMWW